MAPSRASSQSAVVGERRQRRRREAWSRLREATLGGVYAVGGARDPSVSRETVG